MVYMEGNNAIRLDVGCGETKTPGFIGIDKRKMPGVDIVLNLDNEHLPFDDSTVDEIYTSHSLEHLSDFEEVMLEFSRVLKPHGKLTVIVPFYSSPVAFEPTHKLFFNPFSLNFFTEDRSTFKYNKPYFRFVKEPELRFNFFKDWRDALLKPFEFFANHFMKIYLILAFAVPAHEIKFELVRNNRKYLG